MFLNENRGSTFLFHSSFVFRHILVCFCVIIPLIAGKYSSSIFNAVPSSMCTWGLGFLLDDCGSLTVKCDKIRNLRLYWKFSAVYQVCRWSQRRANPITSDPLTGMSGES